jgi:hypothetical protein
MFDLERAVSTWRTGLIQQALDVEVIDELESHLRDAYAEHSRKYRTDEKAFELAQRQLGDQASIVSAFDGTAGELPLALKIVAVVFLLFGLGQFAGAVDSVYSSELDLRLFFGPLMVACSFQLLRLRKGWRLFALFNAYLMMTVSALLMVGLLYASRAGSIEGPFDMEVLNWVLGMTMASAFFALGLWQQKVLTRPDIRRLFAPVS